jgi:hypothetical protein
MTTPSNMPELNFTTTVTGINTRGQDADIKVRTQGMPDRIYLPLVGDFNTNGFDDGDGNGRGRTVPTHHCDKCGNQFSEELDAANFECVDDAGHDVKEYPLAWANNVQIDLDPEKNEIVVSISVADPRGGFSMIIRREEANGELRMSVPTDARNEHQQHAPLTLLASPGYYRIGNE